MDHDNETADLLSRVKQGVEGAFEMLLFRYRAAALSWARNGEEAGSRSSGCSRRPSIPIRTPFSRL